MGRRERMGGRFPFVCLLGASFLMTLFAAGARAAPGPFDVIYGADDRLDLYQVEDPRWLKAAESTVALFHGGSVKNRTLFGYGRRYGLDLTKYASSYHLCQDEPFYEQEAGAFCSGTLVGPDLVLTAGHCVGNALDCMTTRFVFDFGIREFGVQPRTAHIEDVYSCQEIVKVVFTVKGPDWSLVRLDRKVIGREPVRLNRDPAPIAGGTGLVMIGHPSGLPTKVAGGARVRDPNPEGYFVATTDSYGGNSGSGVFNAVTGLLEGVLVRGEEDFVEDEVAHCFRSKRCREEECRGEDVTKISEIAPWVSEL